MLVYLLSKPDNWKVQIRDLINQTANCFGKRSGRDKVYAILNELRMAGYLFRSFRREGGEFKGVLYEVSECPDLEAGAAFIASLVKGPNSPLTANPETDIPLTDLPETDLPNTANPEALDKTEKASNTEKTVITAGPGKARGTAVNGSLKARKAKAQDDTDPELPGAPDNYPRRRSSKTYAAWVAYARAFHAKYRQWPVYNRTVAGQMAKTVERIGDDAPLAARFYVEKVDHQQVTSTCHPVSYLLKHCESYLIQARQAEDVRKRAQANQKAIEQAMSSPTLPLPQPRQKPAPQQPTGAIEHFRQQLGETLRIPRLMKRESKDA